MIYMKEKEKFGEVGQSTNERIKGIKTFWFFIQSSQSIGQRFVSHRVVKTSLSAKAEH